MIQIDDAYLYCMLKASERKYMLQTKDENDPVLVADGVFPKKRVSGVFVFDFQRMIRDTKIELYRLSRAIVGVDANMDYSKSL